MSAPLNLTIKNRLEDMEIGDCIPCRYTATTSGTAGYFSELGTCTVTEIPTTSSATPDGLFYFIKVDKGTLIADRVIQHSISWDTLNNRNWIEGTFKPIHLSNFSNSNMIINNNSGIASKSGNVYSGIASSTNTDTNGYKFTQNYIFLNNYNNNISVYLKLNNLTVSSPTNIIPTGMIIGYTLTTQKVVQIGVTDKLTTYDIYTLNDITGLSLLTKISKVKPLEIMISSGNTNKVIINNIVYDGETLSSATWASTTQNQVFIQHGYQNSTGSILSNVDYFGYSNKIIPSMILPSNTLIRSLSGGCAYTDSNGNKSLTDKSKGAWPTNEYDTYIVNSNLNNKITPGDDNIWHWNILTGIWCKETPVSYVNYNNITVNNTYRTLRGYKDSHGITRTTSELSNTIANWGGFRPVLEYIESTSKQTNLFY